MRGQVNGDIVDCDQGSGSYSSYKYIPQCHLKFHAVLVEADTACVGLKRELVKADLVDSGLIQSPEFLLEKPLSILERLCDPSHLQVSEL
jgi:hypothetical protein